MTKLPGKILGCTLFHGNLLVAIEGGQTFIWVEDCWRSLRYDPPPPGVTLPSGIGLIPQSTSGY